MSCLPDELWSRILEIGIQNPNSSLTYKDLCCLSIASRRLHRLSNDEALWSSLISSDFPLNQYPTLSSSSSSSSSSSKALYKIRFERDRDRKLAAHRRTVLRIESQVAEHSRKLQEIKLRSVEETEKMKAAVAELSNLRKVRQASVALNVWQPEVIRGRHKQIVEQCVVPADSRIHALEMELRLCKQQIAGLDKAYVSEVPNMFHLLNFGAWDRTFMMLLNVTWQKDEIKRFDAAKEQLTSTKYHPLRNYNLASDGVDKYGMKRKKFIKEHINGKMLD